MRFVGENIFGMPVLDAWNMSCRNLLMIFFRAFFVGEASNGVERCQNEHGSEKLFSCANMNVHCNCACFRNFFDAEFCLWFGRHSPCAAWYVSGGA
jgi:hypothetical protein